MKRPRAHARWNVNKKKLKLAAKVCVMWLFLDTFIAKKTWRQEDDSGWLKTMFCFLSVWSWHPKMYDWKRQRNVSWTCRVTNVSKGKETHNKGDGFWKDGKLVWNNFTCLGTKTKENHRNYAKKVWSWSCWIEIDNAELTLKQLSWN